MDQEKIKHAVSELLEAFGEDPQREGLKERHSGLPRCMLKFLPL